MTGFYNPVVAATSHEGTLFVFLASGRVYFKTGQHAKWEETDPVPKSSAASGEGQHPGNTGYGTP